MASKKKSQPHRKLFSDKRLTVDSNGRLRIGGRFASRRQVGSWVGARKRRNLPHAPQRSIPKKKRVTKSPSKASKKGAATKALEAAGIEKTDDYFTPGVGYHKIIYRLPDFSPETIKLVVDREALNGEDFFMYLFAEGEDEYGEPQEVGTAFYIGMLNGKYKNRTSEIVLMSKDLEDQIGVYTIASIDAIDLVISPAL